MKSIFLVLLFLLNFICCNQIVKEKDYELDICEEARLYIGECINATLPELETCDEEFARSVLNQHCDSIIEYIFN
jgi:hypothetical protein